MIQYAEGDGNDSIDGFDKSSRLRIGDGTGTYSSSVSGSNVILTVGDGLVTLTKAAKLDMLNIVGKEVTQGGGSIIPTFAGENINNSDDDVTLRALADKDCFIKNDGINVSIEGKNGDDTIDNRNSNVTITAGAGNDSIVNRQDGFNVTIKGGDGADSIYNSGDNVSINGDADNDTVYNDGYYVTIAGGEDDNSVRTSGGNTSIISGSGKDYIYSSGSNVTINSGKGDDVIEVDKDAQDNVIIYKYGDGNDTINAKNYHLKIEKPYSAHVTLTPENDNPIKENGQWVIKVVNEKITLADELPEEYKAPTITRDITLTEDDDTHRNTLKDKVIEFTDSTGE